MSSNDTHPILSDHDRASFLIGLAKLTRETGVAIGGCGCCGSPYLFALNQDELDERAGYGSGFVDSVAWISPDDAYDWKHYAGSIVHPQKLL